MRKEKLFTAGHRAVLFFCRFPPAGSEKIRQKDERDFSGDHEGGKGIDFRRNPSLHHGVDVKRESCRIRSGCEEADDEVIDGQCESDERARSDSRHDEGKRDVAEALPRTGIQIAGGFFVFLFQPVKPRPHRDDYERQAEGDVGEDDACPSQR